MDVVSKWVSCLIKVVYFEFELVFNFVGIKLVYVSWDDIELGVVYLYDLVFGSE